MKLRVYYAHPENTFYADLSSCGFTDRTLNPQQYQRLLEFGIGLDDVYNDRTGLRNRLIEARPHAVCFNSKAALARFAGTLEGPWAGKAASGVTEIPGIPIVWAVPDSSPRARRHHDRRIRLLKELYAVLH